MWYMWLYIFKCVCVKYMLYACVFVCECVCGVCSIFVHAWYMCYVCVCGICCMYVCICVSVCVCGIYVNICSLCGYV